MADVQIIPQKVDDAVDTIENYLGKVAGNVEPAWHLSGALESLQSATPRDGCRISDGQCDRLLAALVNVRAAAVALFETAPDQAAAARGIDAAAAVVVIWSEDERQRAARHRHVWPDLRAHVRVLRNLVHNISLLDEIRARADARVAETVQEVMRLSRAA